MSEYDPETDPLEIWEQHRRDAMRTFKVYLLDLTVETVFAHFWNNTEGAGHLNFYTIEPSGRKTIRRLYQTSAWWKVEEVDDAKTDRAMMALHEGEPEVLTRRPAKGVH